jgi:hypothetical protein
MKLVDESSDRESKNYWLEKAQIANKASIRLSRKIANLLSE